MSCHTAGQDDESTYMLKNILQRFLQIENKEVGKGYKKN